MRFSCGTMCVFAKLIVDRTGNIVELGHNVSLVKIVNVDFQNKKG